ncbi:hypothetical protein J6590_082480 [Homalodisca vitripennis]|nr:hypothetical protein J6590_082480 [Homalodisca vitripennis]
MLLSKQNNCCALATYGQCGLTITEPSPHRHSADSRVDTAKYKIIESEKVSALWCNGSTFTRQVRDPGSTPGGANTAKYKIIKSEKVSALWCNGSTFTRQVRDPFRLPAEQSSCFVTIIAGRAFSIMISDDQRVFRQQY